MANPIAVPGTVVPTGSLATPSGAQGVQGIQGPTAISADAGNLATLGSDNLILVPQSSLWSMRLRSFNAIGNPTFEVDQRNVGNIVAGATWNTPIIDRWFAGRISGGAMAVSAGQQTLISGLPLPGTNFIITRNFFRITLTTAQATLAAGDLLAMLQYPEGPQWRELQNDVHSLSLLVRSSVAGLAFSAFLADQSAATKSLCNLCTIPLANTWTLITLPNLPAWAAGGKFTSAPGNNAYQIGICLAAGSTYMTPANASWQNGNFLGAVGQSNFAASPVNSTFDVAFIQHEPGPVCSTPIDCPFTQNYDNCLRYFCKTYDYDTAVGTAVNIGTTRWWPITTTFLGQTIRFPKAMAKIPAIVHYNSTTGAVNSVNVSGTAYVVSSANDIGKGGFDGITTTTAMPAPAIGNTALGHYIADTGW